MRWRAALIDSCGTWPGAAESAAFADDGGRVERRAPVADPTGHGSRVARLLADDAAAVELFLGQVFLDGRPASAAAVAAAVDWAVAAGADLIHMSLGLAADRAVLGAAVQRAVELGRIIVAAAPARGAMVFPAGYAGVLRATGDARCAPGELSHLGHWFFGGCPRFEPGVPAESDNGAGGGASIGAAWVSRTLLSCPRPPKALAAVDALASKARYRGPERRARVSG